MDGGCDDIRGGGMWGVRWERVCVSGMTLIWSVSISYLCSAFLQQHGSGAGVQATRNEVRVLFTVYRRVLSDNCQCTNILVELNMICL